MMNLRLIVFLTHRLDIYIQYKPLMSFAVETSLPIPPDNRFSSLRDFFHLNFTVGNESAGPKKQCLTWSLH